LKIKTVMKLYYLVLLLIVVAFGHSCQSEKVPNNSFAGTWASIGSGLLLEIKDSTSYSFYDITSKSCLPSRKGNLKELQKSVKNDTLTLKEGILIYKFIRTEKLPELCKANLKKGKRKDPLYNFDVFAETVKEHYAYMELNSINWDKLYSAQREKLNQKSTDAELYLLIEETLEKLNDNHAFLEATDDVYEELDKLEEAESENLENELPELGDFSVAQMVAEHHLEEEMTRDSWLIQWGKLTNEIGYIQVKSMWLYAKLDIPPVLVKDKGFVDAFIETRHKMYEAEYIEKEVQGVRKIMDKVMNDLANMESIVIDVRFNGGGQDAVSFEILSRFSQHRQQVTQQKFRYGDKFTEVVPIYVEGVNDAFTKPVYLLTSPQTGSAAESLALGSMSLANVKRIGAPTQGAISTTLDKTLPNGWVFSISNEIAMDKQGNCYENIGVPVDYKLDYSRDRQGFFRSVADDLVKDKRDILNAIKSLKVN